MQVPATSGNKPKLNQKSRKPLILLGLRDFCFPVTKQLISADRTNGNHSLLHIRARFGAAIHIGFCVLPGTDSP